MPEVALPAHALNGVVGAAMNALRELRRAISLGQREFAALLSIPLETYRPWESARHGSRRAVRTRSCVPSRSMHYTSSPDARPWRYHQAMIGAGPVVVHRPSSNRFAGATTSKDTVQCLSELIFGLVVSS